MLTPPLRPWLARTPTILLISLITILTAAQQSGPGVLAAPSPGIVISQVYGGGGNSGATLRNDFIELFNRGSVAVSVNGWSVQYASATGTTWQKTDLSGTIQPGQYYLVQQAQGAGGTTSLPTPDAIGTIAMASTSGKVALVTTQVVLACGATAGSCGSNASVQDFVGYGSSASDYEGSGPTGSLSNTTAALRDAGGCEETDSSAADFSVGAPAPRNTASPLAPCSGPRALSVNDVAVTEGDSGTVTASFTVSLSAPAGPGGVSFDIATGDGTATTADGDYLAANLAGQVIPAGQQTFTFEVTVFGDTTIEPNETFSVTLSNVAGAALGDGEGLGTIVNDDFAPPVFDVVISQVYGGGGNSGATLRNDFVELFNRGTTAVSLAGWSVQYTSSAGTSWQLTPLGGSIAPGGYYLVQQAAGAGGTTSLPAPDVTGSVAMSATAGKVILRSTATALAGACPTDSTIVDVVGYGSATCFEGTAPAPPLSNTAAALRKRGGCSDSNNNTVDFATGSPVPPQLGVARPLVRVHARRHPRDPGKRPDHAVLQPGRDDHGRRHRAQAQRLLPAGAGRAGGSGPEHIGGHLRLHLRPAGRGGRRCGERQGHGHRVLQRDADREHASGRHPRRYRRQPAARAGAAHGSHARSRRSSLAARAVRRHARPRGRARLGGANQRLRRNRGRVPGGPAAHAGAGHRDLAAGAARPLDRGPRLLYSPLR